MANETVNGNCSGSQYPEYKASFLTVTQAGNSLTIDNNGTTCAGTISGSSVKWNTSTPDGSGTLAVSFSGTVSGDGNTVSGSATWTWSNNSYSCNGTSELSAERIVVE
jgi:hypothetical protein